MRNRLLLTTASITVVFAMTACGGDDQGTAATGSPAPASASAAATPAAAPLRITDPWVKTADKGMTAAFGTLVNTTGTDITITEAATPASSKVELHEVAGAAGEMKMQPVNGGFVVPANGKLELKPGGFHIMLMDVTRPIEPGDQVAFTLTLAGGAKAEFTALAKAFQGGNESYAPDHR
jgi:copper(I)-binding protein